MKSIGIGNLKKAQPKEVISLSRHDFQAGLGGIESEEGQLSIDVYQTETELILLAPVAGTPPDQLNVSITDDVITIKGRRELPLKNTSSASIYLQECFWGNFSRSFILPIAVDLSHAEARFKNNVLTVRIPKADRVRSRMIKIEE